MTKIRKHLVSSKIASRVTYGGINSKKYIVIHETANTSRGADANAHARLQANGNSRAASWHYTVDDKEIVQSFSDDAQCWHAGNASYNKQSIGIEICVNSDGDYLKAVENAIELTKYLMSKYNIPASNVIQHNHASGKNCPRYLREGSKGITWGQFKDKLGGVTSKVSYSKPTKSRNSKSKWITISGDWNGSPVLRNGHHGNPVRKLQTMLANKKYLKKSQIDGYFGSDTENAVRKAQKDGGIKVDGLAGKDTYRVLVTGKKKTTSTTRSSKENLTIDGKWGKDTTKALQRALGMKVIDGVLSGQPRNSVTQALYGCVSYGSGGSPTVKALQRKIGAKQDGKMGPDTVRKLQRYLGTTVDGKISRPTSLVVKEMQKRLNNGSF